MPASRHWKEVAREAQAYRDASVDRVNPSLEDTSDGSKNAYRPALYQDCARKHPVTSVPLEQLRLMLAAGEVTAIEVTRAFLERAAVAQKLVWPLISCTCGQITYCRLIASLNYSQSRLCNEHDFWTTTLPITRHPWDLCMVYRSV